MKKILFVIVTIVALLVFCGAFDKWQRVVERDRAEEVNSIFKSSQ